ncbi:MAG: rhodanese-like domain-containing protein [Candidatus Firestonebacteria bacterium]|nr:rhodanese-like domain-containing protein [Candidatus Firestonebacteria bacterium]
MNKPRLSWAQVFRQAAILFLVAAALGLAANQLRPQGVSWAPRGTSEITPAEMVAGMRAGRILLIDARSSENYARGHAAGAVNFPAREKNQHPDWVHAKLPLDQTLVVYCQNAQCLESRDLAEFLVSQGIDPKRISVFSPGWDKFQGQSLLPVKTGAEP